MLFIRIFLMAMPIVLSGASMLQAEVTVKQSRTTLSIRGDGASDEVRIVGLSRNAVTVSVNGGDPDAYTNVQSIKISMGKGADFLSISDLTVDGAVDVNLGDNFGDAGIVMNSNIGGSLVLKGGSDLGIENSMVTKDLSLQSGKESVLSDHVDIGVVGTTVFGKATVSGNTKLSDSLLVFDSSFLGNVSVKLGGGDDNFVATNVSMGAKVALDGGKGIDYLEAIDISTVVEVLPKNFELFGPALVE